MILGLDWHAWMTITLVFGMFATLMKTRIPADIVFLSVMALLLVTGCLKTEEALSGFSSTAVVTVGVLFVVVAGLDATGVLMWIVKHLLGEPSSYMKAIVKLMLPVAALSSVMTNTTVVALFIKVVKMWGKKIGIAPSKLLIPLSYAASMGGVCTIIGTAPNLLVSGFYCDYSGEQLGMFSTTIPGMFCLMVGITTIIVLQKLLPERKTPEEDMADGEASLTTDLHVTANSHLPGKTLQDINLLNLCGSNKLIGIVRFDGEVITDIDENEFLMGGDTLIFTGDHDSILQLGKSLGMECNILDKDNEVNIGTRTIVSSAIMIGMVMLSALKVMPLLNSCFIAAMLMLITRCCNFRQAKRAINWDMLMVFACSVTLGKAIEATGLAEMMATTVTDLCGSDALIAFAAVCTFVTFATEFISNTACAAIMAPIGIQIATTLGANPLTFCMGIMISASSSFATPIGSPTNLMVYGPGGYLFSDFMRIGIPMNIIILMANIFISTLLFPL